MTAEAKAYQIIAAGFALCGAVLMMIEPLPSWQGVMNGLICLLMFGWFSLVASWKLSGPPGRKVRDLKPAAKLPAEVQELLPSQLPELGSHLKRRRWRGRYQAD